MSQANLVWEVIVCELLSHLMCIIAIATGIFVSRSNKKNIFLTWILDIGVIFSIHYSKEMIEIHRENCKKNTTYHVWQKDYVYACRAKHVKKRKGKNKYIRTI